jgi:hypothetical protein
MALEALEGKMVFLEGSGGHLSNFLVAESFGVRE